jgi:hypothetical protein
MTIWTCATCGLEYPDTPQPPASCAICEDERQYVPATGQSWTHQAALAADGHQVTVGELEPDLFAVRCSPRFAIGQRGLLLRTPAGNVLWETPGFFDPQAVEEIRALGGVSAITASHPHLVGACVSYSHALGNVPVLWAEADRNWVQRPDPVIDFWAGTLEVLPGVTLLECGGHFAGSSVAHWAAGAGGRGALLTGDTVLVGGDRASVTAMRSYVNSIPLPVSAIQRIADTVAPYAFDRLYAGFENAVIDTDAQRIVADSLTRYIGWITGDLVPAGE